MQKSLRAPLRNASNIGCLQVVPGPVYPPTMTSAPETPTSPAPLVPPPRKVPAVRNLPFDSACAVKTTNWQRLGHRYLFCCPLACLRMSSSQVGKSLKGMLHFLMISFCRTHLELPLWCHPHREWSHQRPRSPFAPANTIAQARAPRLVSSNICEALHPPPLRALCMQHLWPRKAL